ncbi:hypothetical protein L1987_16325 [Smallanthus sonchifolius]|uniref:Uncharacterized protein n=1 Tax=Smallanthus sonchifolius TaxID=185202 RepID=A0ACB9J8F5_9ASTR|nr:hypothetical protein L1987_16325 [Smallanthus sonchifolius]
MSDGILLSSQPKKPFHHRNGSDELDVFEAARYFSGATENFGGTHRNICVESNTFSSNNTQKYSTMPIRRMSLDMPSHRGNSINPLQSMLIENPTMISKEKKFKQPSSPGGKLAHFLNSLFNPTSLKKSKSKKKSTKDEDESPSGWRRKRRSSISHFRSGNTTSITTTTATTTITTAIIMSDKSSYSTSTRSGFRTPPPYHVAHTPTKTTSHRNPGSYSYLKPAPNQITKIPLTENLNKIENFNTKSDFPEKNTSFRNGFVEKVKIFNEKQEHHPHKYVSREDIKEFKKFVDDDDGADSDSSSDLFELTNCDLGYYSSGLPVYKTTHMDNIKRCVPIST